MVLRLWFFEVLSFKKIQGVGGVGGAMNETRLDTHWSLLTLRIHDGSLHSFLYFYISLKFSRIKIINNEQVNKAQGSQQISHHIMVDSSQGSSFLAGRRGRWALQIRGLIPQRPVQQAEKQRGWVSGSRSTALRSQDSPDHQQEEQSGLVVRCPNQETSVSQPSSQHTWWPRITPIYPVFYGLLTVFFSCLFSFRPHHPFEVALILLFVDEEADLEWKSDLSKADLGLEPKSFLWRSCSSPVSSWWIPWG